MFSYKSIKPWISISNAVVSFFSWSAGGGRAWRFRIELQWEQARPWVVTSRISLQLLSWFMIYKCFFCFSFVGGYGLLWISSHRRRWTCVSGAPLKSRTSKSGVTGSRPWVEIFAVFVISQNLEMIFLFCCKGGVSGTPPPLLDLRFNWVHCNRAASYSIFAWYYACRRFSCCAGTHEE